MTNHDEEHARRLLRKARRVQRAAVASFVAAIVSFVAAPLYFHLATVDSSPYEIPLTVVQVGLLAMALFGYLLAARLHSPVLGFVPLQTWAIESATPLSSSASGFTVRLELSGPEERVHGDIVADAVTVSLLSPGSEILAKVPPALSSSEKRWIEVDWAATRARRKSSDVMLLCQAAEKPCQGRTDDVSANYNRSRSGSASSRARR